MKAAKIFLSFLLTASLCLFVGGAAAQVAQQFNYQVNPLVAAATVFTVKTVYFVLSDWTVKGVALAGVNREIWIEKLKENFYSEFPWMDGVEDWSEWVEYNTLNFTVIGTNPVILKNNSSWPIVAAQRTDTAGTVVLDTYDSTTTRVRNVEAIEAAINKLESAVKQHRQSLTQEIVTEAIWNYAPATAAAGAIAVTGANRALVIGSQSTVAATMTLSDIAGLQERWDALDFTKEGRILVLSPYHRRDLIAEDKSLEKEFVNRKTGAPLPLFGFDDVVTVANAPLYTKTTLAKKAYAAAPDNTNDCVASVAFCKKEVMKALGDTEMFHRELHTNPEQRSDEVGFQQRAKVVPQRTTNFYQQALVSNRA